MRQSQKTLLLWLVLLVMFALLWQMFNSARNEETLVDFSVFMDAVENDSLANRKVTIKNGQEFSWQDESGKKRAIYGGTIDEGLRQKLDEHNVSYGFEVDDGFAWTMFVTWVPLLLVFAVLIFFMRQIQSGGGKAMSFGKSRARLLNEAGPKVTFKDVAGVEEAKEELHEIIDFLKSPKRFTRLGGRIPKGVLLMGPPGTGKTLLAKAIAGEANVPFFSISGSDFVEMFVGVGASRVRDLFEQSKKHAPCIIFVDEIDAVGRHRGAGLGGGHDEREQTLNQLLVEMDGFEANEGVILIAATNRPDVLDPALLRPGRFDRRVVVPLPDVSGRQEILEVHTKKVPLDEDVELDVLARGTPGFSGADLSNLVNEAALSAAKLNQTKVHHRDFESAKDKVLMGTERKSMIMSEKELRSTAYHEAGHTLIAAKVENADPVHKVTIIPRGRALGLTQMLPEEDRHSVTHRYALDQICIMFGGRIAEEIMFDELTTGAGNDLQKATEMARKMVCDWGMSKTLGPIAFSQQDQNIFLGRELSRSQEYSEHTAQMIDKEIRTIMEGQYDRARDIIENNRESLAAIAEALMVYETLEAKDIHKLMGGEKLDREPPKSRLKTREDLERIHRAKEEARQRNAEDEGGEDDPGAVLGPLVGSKA